MADVNIGVEKFRQFLLGLEPDELKSVVVEVNRRVQEQDFITEFYGMDIGG